MAVKENHLQAVSKQTQWIYMCINYSVLAYSFSDASRNIWPCHIKEHGVHITSSSKVDLACTLYLELVHCLKKEALSPYLHCNNIHVFMLAE